MHKDGNCDRNWRSFSAIPVPVATLTHIDSEAVSSHQFCQADGMRVTLSPQHFTGSDNCSMIRKMTSTDWQQIHNQARPANTFPPGYSNTRTQRWSFAVETAVRLEYVATNLFKSVRSCFYSDSLFDHKEQLSQKIGPLPYMSYFILNSRGHPLIQNTYRLIDQKQCPAAILGLCSMRTNARVS